MVDDLGVIAKIDPAEIAATAKRAPAIALFETKEGVRAALEGTRSDLSMDDSSALDAALAGTAELTATGALDQTAITAIASMIQNLPVSLRSRIDMILAAKAIELSSSLQSSAATAAAPVVAVAAAPAKVSTGAQEQPEVLASILPKSAEKPAAEEATPSKLTLPFKSVMEAKPPFTEIVNMPGRGGRGAA